MIRMSEKPLFVRLPAAQAEKLDQASHQLKIAKKDLVSALVARHVDPQKLDNLRRVVVEMGREELTVGRADFRPHEQPEVLTLEQAAELLQVEPAIAAELADAGELPGRRIGEDWRFSRSALIAWLAGDG
jgi:excisionase family DNA binding protein